MAKTTDQDPPFAGFATAKSSRHAPAPAQAPEPEPEPEPAPTFARTFNPGPVDNRVFPTSTYDPNGVYASLENLRMLAYNAYYHYLRAMQDTTNHYPAPAPTPDRGPSFSFRTDLPPGQMGRHLARFVHFHLPRSLVELDAFWRETRMIRGMPQPREPRAQPGTEDEEAEEGEQKQVQVVDLTPEAGWSGRRQCLV